jgi:hypothetical protein
MTKRANKKASLSSKTEKEARSAAAALLGRFGGLKGGKARADKLSQEERSQIAANAARARWNKRGE